MVGSAGRCCCERRDALLLSSSMQIRSRVEARRVEYEQIRKTRHFNAIRAGGARVSTAAGGGVFDAHHESTNQQSMLSTSIPLRAEDVGTTTTAWREGQVSHEPRNASNLGGLFRNGYECRAVDASCGSPFMYVHAPGYPTGGERLSAPHQRPGTQRQLASVLG